MVRVSGHEAPVVTRRLCRIAVLMAAATFGSASQAEAALYYWSDSFPGYSQPGPASPERRQKARPRQGKKIETPIRETAKPQGPLIIAISIEKQTLRVYDANGFYAESPVSTGMKGHSTPMGVFSIIQKNKFHRSNIYSGAPMPFMQRITWSGVAMHAGVLPGYPASHGCIRMPLAFATKIWNWTKMGARVVITPGEITPASFSHQRLATQKVVPEPVATNELRPDVATATKADKSAAADAARNLSEGEARLELRSTVGHGVPSAPTPLREQTHTADASGALPAMRASATMSDAASSGRDASFDRKATETTSSENATAEIESAETDTKPDEQSIAAQAIDDAVKLAESAGESTKPDETRLEAKTLDIKTLDIKTVDIKTVDIKVDDARTETVKADASKANEKPDDSVTAATDARPDADVKKDQTRLPLTERPVVAKPEPPKRTGQIAAFVSRKDGKLYVRQNFAPLFDVPVTIASSDRPLGTHVFTARVDKNDANLLHWSVVSLPAPSRYAELRDEDERATRRRKMTGAVETKPVPVANNAAEALDRLNIPADAMARIAEALATGGSIVVSDQGITGSGETGEGTDFIVSLR